ncbi:hypothetical protein J5E74_10640 [Streptococcus pneumoniae]|nr:hypothetical protein [Streptococcus pneumoniae]MBW7509263.1 hypothetical protein [Streptococcus pneumoniae]MBW7513131.1 hypothetical protein [Streptococcus pneumoniae]MBW7516958.1 hypothetical protein [Streptococcus pneumoniae]MBW7551280.1 hypothetical protein [Streptococcus pneumoniae]
MVHFTIIITILDNEENAMANPTFGEKKRIQTILLAMAYMQLSLILNKNKLFLFNNQMVLGSYHVEKLKQVKIIRKP